MFVYAIQIQAVDYLGIYNMESKTVKKTGVINIKVSIAVTSSGKGWMGVVKGNRLDRATQLGFRPRCSFCYLSLNCAYALL